MTIEIHSEPGGKEVNEDCVLARRHPESSSVWICALADGQGGQAHGAEAARVACEAVWEQASAMRAEALLESGTWLRVMDEADRAAARTGGFSTLIALAISRDGVAGASVGDSKAFFLRAGGNEIDEWTQRQRKNPPIGSEAVDAVTFQYERVIGGRLLITSDGVWKYCGYEALKAAFALPLSEVANHLLAAVRKKPGAALPDDFSLIAVEVE